MKKILLVLFVFTSVFAFGQSVSSNTAREAEIKGERVEGMLDDYQNYMDNFLLSNENQKKFTDYNTRLDAIMRQANYWRLRFFNRTPLTESRQDCASYHRAELDKYRALRKERDDWLKTIIG